MKYQIFLLFIMGLLMIEFASAEISMHGDITQDKILQTTTERVVYTLDDVHDASPTGAEQLLNDVFVPVAPDLVAFLKSGNRPVDIQILAQTQGLPLVYSSGVVDWCNVSLSLYHSEYNPQDGTTNTTITKESYYFTATPAMLTTINKQLRLSDQMIVLATCHYTDSNMYENNILAGRITSYVPAFQCAQCTGQSIESLEDIVANENLQMQKDNEFYNFFQNIIVLNFKFWVIFSWIFKIVMLIVSVMLIFAGAIFIYKFFKKLEKKA